MRPWIIAWAIAAIVSSLLEDMLNPYVFGVLMFAGINVIMAVSLNLVNGFTGQFSIGHAGFMAVGAYTAALTTKVLASYFPSVADVSLHGAMALLVALAVAGSMACVVGYCVGLPSLRLRGDYLAIVTLGFGEIIRVVFLNIEMVRVAGVEVDLGGARGMGGMTSLVGFGWVSFFVIATVFVIWRIVHSAHGRALLSIREDEIAGEAMGVHTTRGKVRAFAIAAVFAGVAGGLMAHMDANPVLVPTMFDFNRSFEFIIMVVLGGLGSISGSVVAAIFLTVLKEGLRLVQEVTDIDFRMIIYSLVLIALMLTRPNGLFGSREIGEVLARK